MIVDKTVLKAGGSYLITEKTRKYMIYYNLVGNDVHYIKKGNTTIEEDSWYKTDGKLLDWISKVYSNL